MEIISHAVWLHSRFNLSHRDVGDLLAERGISVTRESICLWCNKFGALYARRLKRKYRDHGGTFFIDEVFVRIKGKQYYLWRAVDQHGDVVDVYLQSKRDGVAAKRFFRRLLRNHGNEARKNVTNKLCDDSNQHGRLEDPLMSMPLCRMYLILTGLWVGAEHYRDLRISAFNE